MDNYLKIAAGSKAFPKRELLRSSKTRQQQQQQQQQQQLQQRSMMRNLTEAITKVNGSSGGVDVSEVNENGIVRMKIRVKKQDLKQMLQAMNNNNNNNNGSISNACSPLSPFSVEQRLNLLRRKHILRANNAAAGKENPRPFWRPMLQSIPEEL